MYIIDKFSYPGETCRVFGTHIAGCQFTGAAYRYPAARRGIFTSFGNPTENSRPNQTPVHRIARDLAADRKKAPSALFSVRFAIRNLILYVHLGARQQVFIIFNRPATTERVFAEIARARPSKLFVIADGAIVKSGV